MAGQYAVLKAAIEAVIKTNGNNEITGALMQQSLLAMITSLGAYYDFVDVATPSTNPGTPDQNVMYFAATAGTYTNFGGIVVNDGEFCALCWNGSWIKKTTGAATATELAQLEKQVNGGPEDVTPTTQSGFYYSVSANMAVNATANAGSKYTGTTSAGSGIIPTNGVDVSGYIGKTIRTKVTNRSGSSERCTIIIDAGGKAVAYVSELNYVLDDDGAHADLVIPEGAKYYFWSGIYDIVSVQILDAESGLRGDIVNIQQDIQSIDGRVQTAEEEINGIKEKTDKIVIDNKVSSNLLDPSKIIQGYYVGGEHYGGDSYVESDYIPVVPGTTYKVMCTSWGSTYYWRFVAFFNEQKEWISGQDLTSTGIDFSVPVGASFAKVSLYKIDDLSTYGVFANSVSVFEPYYDYYYLALAEDNTPINEKANSAILKKGDIAGVIDLGTSGKIKVVIGYPKATIYDGNNHIEVAIDYQQARIIDANKTIYDSNPIFNFYSMLYNGKSLSSDFKDDVAPAHFLGQTLGANHGQPISVATITNHGLNNTAIGTAWNQNGVSFYVMRIIDSNNVVFLSQNSGTRSAPVWTALSTGTITNGSQTLTISEISGAQCFPSVKNREIALRLDGEIISEDGVYYGKVLDFVESYEIMNPSSVLDNIIARAGQSSDPEYNGDSAARVETIYRFLGLNVLVIANFIAEETIQFQDIMFSQANRKGSNGVVKYYIPNSLPFGTYDFRQPLAVTWGQNVDTMYCYESQTKDPTKPINRIIQYSGNDLGFAIGFLTDFGVGKALFDYTNHTFELRGNTGKVYPRGVSRAVAGNSLGVGDGYNAVIYRCLFKPESSGNRLSVYHFPYNGAEYVFLDYKGSVVDHVVLDESFDGMGISVIEAQNAELLTDVYNNGFYVNANFVADETCYLVAKILKS